MWYNYKNTQAASWALVFLISILSTMLGIALTMAILVHWYPMFRHPISVELIDPGFTGKLCPGNEITTRLEATVEGELTIDVLWGYTNVEGTQSFLGHEIGVIMLPVPIPGGTATYQRSFGWTVPRLDPDKYIGLRGYYVRDSAYDIVYLRVPFEIDLPENCD